MFIDATLCLKHCGSCVQLVKSIIQTKIKNAHFFLLALLLFIHLIFFFVVSGSDLRLDGAWLLWLMAQNNIFSSSTTSLSEIMTQLLKTVHRACQQVHVDICVTTQMETCIYSPQELASKLGYNDIKIWTVHSGKYIVYILFSRKCIYCIVKCGPLTLHLHS